MDGGGSTDMTLAFELEALKRLARPEEVFSDARTWSEYVGVVSEKPTYVVTNFTRKKRIRQDFFSGPRGREESLENVKAQFDTDRHVFVGVDEEDAELAEAVGWEFLRIDQAAEAADWELGDSETPDSLPEVPLAARIERDSPEAPALDVTGRIDRLAVLDNTVLIVDYKTNRPAPERAADVAAAHVAQLAAYRIAVAALFPGKRVCAALLWTDGPRLMEIPEAMLARAEAAIRAGGSP
jgi:hypothetical protein